MWYRTEGPWAEGTYLAEIQQAPSLQTSPTSLLFRHKDTPFLWAPLPGVLCPALGMKDEGRSGEERYLPVPVVSQLPSI